MLDLRKLQLLRELSYRRTIAAVADAAAYTPSAVSQQLSALERDVGVRLLERSGRSVELTPAGRMLVAHSEVILAAVNEAEADLAVSKGALVDELRMGACPSVIRTLVTPAIVSLSTANPGLGIVVNEVDPALAPDALRAGSLDIALVQEYDHVPLVLGDGLDSEPLLTERVYLAATIPDLTSAQLRAATWISGSAGTLCDTLTERFCWAEGFAPRVRHRVDDFSAMAAMVSAGQGLALIPRLGADDVPSNVVLNRTGITRTTSLAFRRGTQRSPSVAAARVALVLAARTGPGDRSTADQPSPSLR
ncbi:LysR family transcriptional regulator [Gordonia oryzae]|uniref:LysR family transcriptional regulator n=1 Tax=Gordonia oryzae TaxID=2487349 RepID=A0A3N4G673_9ACTN|nr:LysR family transcriptional regulator [Gordonia oryzae]RPA58309.1 LysR family transcriptional regulator [Gordonia oryzae]